MFELSSLSVLGCKIKNKKPYLSQVSWRLDHVFVSLPVIILDTLTGQGKHMQTGQC